MIILLPHTSGCDIIKGHAKQFISGDVDKVLKKVKDYVVFNGVQLDEIYLDISGIGAAYADWLKHNNVAFNNLRSTKIIH